MIGDGYWATGIKVRANRASDGRVGWGAEVDYLDDGFVSDDADTGHISTEGRLRTRYFVKDGDTVGGLTAAIDVVIRDAARLGIGWRDEAGGPHLYVDGDGEDPDVWLPDGWRELLAEQSARLGWSGPG